MNQKIYSGKIPMTAGTLSAAENYKRILSSSVAANNAAAEETAAEAQRNAETQTEALRQQYGAAQKQLYRDYMEDKKTLPQSMAAQGYSGGLSESSLVKLAAEYGENLNENERARLQQESTIAAQTGETIRKARAQAKAANAEAQQSYYDSLAALAQEEYDRAVSAREEKAETMAAAGDFSGYQALGYTDEEIRYLTAIWLGRNPKLQETWISNNYDMAQQLGYV